MKKIKIYIALLFGIFSLFLLNFLYKNTEYTVKARAIINSPIDLTYNAVEENNSFKKWFPFRENTSIVNLKEKPFYLINKKIKSGNHMYLLFWTFDSDKKGTRINLKIADKSRKYNFYSKSFKKRNKEKIFLILDSLESYLIKQMNKHQITINKSPIYLTRKKYIYNKDISTLQEKRFKTDSLFRKLLKRIISNKIKRTGNATVFIKKQKNDEKILIKTSVPIRIDKNINDSAYVYPGGKYIKAIHSGDYKYLDESWKEFYKWFKNKNYKIDSTREAIEIYTKGKVQSMNPANWEVELYIPIQ